MQLHIHPFPRDTRDRNIHAMYKELRGVEEVGRSSKVGHARKAMAWERV